MRYGVNYTPSRGWFHHWLDLDLGAVREDLAGLAGLGADHVRIFPLWPLLQPHRGLIRTAAIDDLCAVVAVAAELGLDVTVDVLQGHLSSFDFYPAWTRTWHERNIYADPDVVLAQADLLRAVASALRGRPNVLGVSLGNEMNNMVPHNPVAAEQVEQWLDTLLAAVTDAWPDGQHVHNAYDAVWYTAGHPFTPHAVATKGAMTVVHPWVFSGNCAQRYGPLAPETVHLAEYAVELAKGHAVAAGRPVWVQEIGAPAPHIPAGDAPAFARQALANVATCTDVWGVTWWCSHDVDMALLDFPELEYTLGLLTNDRRRKPLADVYAAATAAGHPGGDNSKKERTAALVLDDAEQNRPAAGPGGAFFDAWMDAAKQGERLAIVSATQAADSVLLAARGITELRHPRERI
jgi:hypothetical protein